MPKRTIRLLAAMCVVAAVLVGVTRARAAGPQYVFYTGLFTVGPNEIAYCYLTIDDQPRAPSARVVLEFLDENSAVLAHRDVTVPSGQTGALRTPGPDLMRCRIKVFETATTPLSPQRTMLPSAEVINSVTNGVRPIPMHDSQQIPSRP